MDPKVITPPQLPVIASYFWLKISILTYTDTIILIILQKWENRQSDLPLDILKMQVG
jgi:hypothetical protein